MWQILEMLHLWSASVLVLKIQKTKNQRYFAQILEEK